LLIEQFLNNLCVEKPKQILHAEGAEALAEAEERNANPN